MTMTATVQERPARQEADVSAGLMPLILDELDYGIMLATNGGELLFANRVARRDCLATGLLRVQAGCLHADAAGAQRDLRLAMDAAAAGMRRLVKLGSGAGAGTLFVAVVPIRIGGASATESGVLLVLGRRDVCELLSIEFFAREHRLTMTETSVLRELCKGLSPGQVATGHGVALATVRSHVSNMRMKTGAESISAMVRMLTLLPPIVPVLV